MSEFEFLPLRAIVLAAIWIAAPAVASAQELALSCEADNQAGFVVHVDVDGKTMGMGTWPPQPISVDAEQFRFELNHPPTPAPNGGWYVGQTYSGSISRLSGAFDAQQCTTYHNGAPSMCQGIHARCRQATQKF